MADYYCDRCRVGARSPHSQGVARAIVARWETLRQRVPGVVRLGRIEHSDSGHMSIGFVSHHSGHGVRVVDTTHAGMDEWPEAPPPTQPEYEEAWCLIRELIGPHCFAEADDRPVWHWFWNNHSAYTVASYAIRVFHSHEPAEFTTAEFQLAVLHMGGPFMPLGEVRDVIVRSHIFEPADGDGNAERWQIKVPYRDPADVIVDPAWRTSTVISLVRGIMADQAFDRMPILADALQDAGCDNEGVLGHLRTDRRGGADETEPARLKQLAEDLY